MQSIESLDHANSAQPDQPGRAQLFVTPVAKFIAMSLCTFGVYEAYWSYKNWRFVKERDGSSIRPFWRAAFYPLWHHTLLSEVGEVVQSAALSNGLYRGFLGGSVILLSATWRLPDPWWLVSFLTFLPFLPALIAMSKVDSPGGPIQESVTTHRPANFIAYLAGGPIVAFTVLSSIGYFPSTAVVAGDYLWDRDVEYLETEGILGPEEDILYFYSEGLWSIKEGGQFISDEYVTSYWRDPEDGESYMAYAAYAEIDDVEVLWAEGLLGLTVVTITTMDELEFELWLSSEGGGDKMLVEKMRQLWKQNRAI